MCSTPLTYHQLVNKARSGRKYITLDSNSALLQKVQGLSKKEVHIYRLTRAHKANYIAKKKKRKGQPMDTKKAQIFFKISHMLKIEGKKEKRGKRKNYDTGFECKQLMFQVYISDCPFQVCQLNLFLRSLPQNIPNSLSS